MKNTEVTYVDERGRRLSGAAIYRDRVAVLRAGVRTRFYRDLRINGESVYEPNFVMPPGGMLAIDITPPGYWGEDAWEDGPVPEWAPAKLATLKYAKVGPYTIAGQYDPNGNGPNGQGVTPYWFDYRNCAEGRRAAATELIGMVNRTPICYTSPVDLTRYSLAIPTPPRGYEVDLERARAWDPDCDDYLRYRRHDGQHLMRGYRAALALAKLGDRFAEDISKLYLEHARYAWGPGKPIPEDNTNPALWGVDQWIERGLCREGIGREFAHVARLVWTVEPEGEFAEKLEKMVHLASEGGQPWFLNPDPQYAKWARECSGGPFGDDEPIAMTREWMLAGEAMRLRRSLSQIRRDMVEFCGIRPAGAMNGEGTGFRAPNPDYELFYNDLSQYEDDPARVLETSSRRHPESAAMPMDSWPKRFWRDHI